MYVFSYWMLYGVFCFIMFVHSVFARIWLIKYVFVIYIKKRWRIACSIKILSLFCLFSVRHLILSLFCLFSVRHLILRLFCLFSVRHLILRLFCLFSVRLLILRLNESNAVGRNHSTPGVFFLMCNYKIITSKDNLSLDVDLNVTYVLMCIS